MVKQKLTDQQIKKDKTERLMNIIARKAAYYRSNPHRFAKEFLGINLKLFQKILLYAMMHYDAFYFVAARGLGKTFLVSLFAVIRCILYPGTQVVVCSATFKQGKEVVNKITNIFMHKSPLLRNEVERVSTGQNDCGIWFKNGSYIRVVVASDNARGARSNILIIDESRLVAQKIVDTVLKPMGADPRHPGYLDKPEYAHLAEMNKEMYMSSAYYAQSEMYEKVKAYVANSLDPRFKYFICDLPYQLSIKEGLLLREAIENEMSEATFSQITFMMEREGLFYGSSEDALFDFNILKDRRILVDGLRSLEYYRDNGLKVPEKQKGEKRVLSVDVALLASKKHNNDASAILIHSAIPTVSQKYIDNINYIETHEGLLAEELGMIVMRMFYQYHCDFIAFDAAGVGQAVIDFLMVDRYDPVYGQTYGALNYINAPELSDRCKVKGAPKVIYAIKANGRSNNDMCVALRSGFQNGYINLLTEPDTAKEKLSKIKGFSKLSVNDQDKLTLPYIQTSLLIEELTNLEHDFNNGLIKVRERSGMRKDRYSSLLYGYYVVQELSKKLKPKTKNTINLASQLVIRRGRQIVGI